jgi:hypothetical protein
MIAKHYFINIIIVVREYNMFIENYNEKRMKMCLGGGKRIYFKRVSKEEKKIQLVSGAREWKSFKI